MNRSQAVRPSQCACRNVFPGMRRLRSGAGSIPWSCRIRFTVVRAISWPRFESAPRIRVYPHWGFSTAIRTTRAATSRRVIGRPRPRRALPSYVWAITLRYQRRIVSGVTMPATCIQTRRPSCWPRTARRRRWASVRRSDRWPRCSREDPILLPEIRDQIVLVAVHPASERENEELERRRHGLRLLGRLDQH